MTLDYAPSNGARTYLTTAPGSNQLSGIIRVGQIVFFRKNKLMLMFFLDIECFTYSTWNYLSKST